MTGRDPFTGIAPATPRPIANRPGQSVLARRIGNRADFYTSMLAAFDGAANGILTRDEADPALALLDSAATMLAIVTRYTEAHAQEHYLDTATERRALVGLAGLTGARLSAGRAAETHLQFTVAAAIAGVGPGEAPAEVLIPAGTRVQSIPLPGERPVTYRTAVALAARGERNAVPLALHGRAAIPGDAISYRIAGSANGLLGATLAIGTRVARVMSVTPEGDDAVLGLEDGDLPTGTWPQRALTTFVPPAADVTAATLQALLASRVRQAEVEQAGADRRWDMDALAEALASRATAADAAAGITLAVLGGKAALFGHNGPDVIRQDAAGKLVTSPGVRATDTIAQQGIGTARTFDLDGSVTIAPGALLLLREGAKTVLGSLGGRTERTARGFNLQQRVTRIRLGGSGNDAEIAARTLMGTEVLIETQRLRAAPPPLPAILTAGTARLELAGPRFGLRIGAPLVVTGSRADGDGASVSQLRSIADVELDGGRTVLVLDSATDTPLLRASVRIGLNVARAIQGELVSEVLGSGDAGRQWQRFALKQGPLSWVAGTGGVVPDIEVRVGGIAWTRRDSFAGAGPDDRIWVLETTLDGAAAVTFGDGLTGARLPTGQENVTARYGKGIGRDGLVRPGQLTLLLDRPAGVTAATNPLAGGGGADPDRPEEARRALPIPMRAMGRAVTLQDYADLALAIPGVAEARADWLWDGHHRIAAISAAGAGGAVLDAQSFANIAATLAGAGEAGVRVRLLQHRPRSFALAAGLAIDPAHAPATVLDAAAAALSAAFGFGARRLAQPVWPSEVVTVLQAVPGVAAVDLDALWPLDGAPPAPGTTPAPILAAAAALTAGQPLGAALLLIEANPRRRLHVL